MLLDEIMPAYQFSSGIHTTAVQAPPDRIFRAIKETRPTDIPLFNALFAIRSWPARIMGREEPYFAKDDTPILKQAIDQHEFVMLAEATDREMVFGAIGKWWLLRGAEFCRLASAGDFAQFDQPGYARAVGSFSVEADEQGGAATVRHETRIYAPDAATRRKFALYWALIYPGVVLIRKMWLRSIKRRAEQE